MQQELLSLRGETPSQALLTCWDPSFPPRSQAKSFLDQEPRDLGTTSNAGTTCPPATFLFLMATLMEIPLWSCGKSFPPSSWHRGQQGPSVPPVPSCLSGGQTDTRRSDSDPLSPLPSIPAGTNSFPELSGVEPCERGSAGARLGMGSIRKRGKS